MKDPEVTVYEKVRIASQAYTFGDAVMLDTTSDAIDVVPATASTTNTNLYGVCLETVAATATEMLIAVITDKQEWSADADGAASTNHNKQNMLLTDKDSVNNTGANNTTKEAVFKQKAVISTSKIVGTFNKVAGVTA